MSWHRLHIFQYGEISYIQLTVIERDQELQKKRIFQLKKKNVKFMFAIYAQRVEKEVE